MGGDLVDALICALCRQHRGDKELEGIGKIELAVSIRVFRRESSADVGGALSGVDGVAVTVERHVPYSTGAQVTWNA